jgi:hypothetical protein
MSHGDFEGMKNQVTQQVGAEAAGAADARCGA